ncbi:hypothetical protein K2173_001206 [Erythroxylum novogranatense]|uniref:RING-type domain-containing protein n=1 Tax=Erythroxylum novogranatense TaxID=1862640 RepID=A0AAV8T4G6_9ROSI|nr:hypothetical protein K2173_001206 [Erythroxylum novogranatense]
MGGQSSMGALVPVHVLRSDDNPETTSEPPPPPPEDVAGGEGGAAEVDKDLLCPICMQIIKDAFTTACGHSFCYACILTHLRNKDDCPCCARYLTSNLIFPNFLLNKLLDRASARQMARHASPIENFRRALQQGCEVSFKELDGLLSVLADKKRKMEQEEAETNIQILLQFLHCVRKQKLEELKEIQTDLQYISEDINSVEKHATNIHWGKGKCSLKLRMLRHDPSTEFDTCPESTVAGKKWHHASFNELQEYYLQKRRYWARQTYFHDNRDTNISNREGYNAGLEDFRCVLTTFTRHSRLRVVAELRHADIFHSANIVSSIEFDRDNELFATAGVSRRIKVFEFSSVMNEPADVHFPIVEMTTRSKLSCLSWSKYAKNLIASCDYEGIVTVWDTTTHQSLMEYEEHEKRTWSVDFSCTEPSMLVSGSDDCKVKIWNINQEASVLNIDMKANICSVKYNPGSSIYLAVGSADHNVHYYDLRSIKQPLNVFNGHRKTVSYVKFLSNYELASASTDNTLRLWDVKESLPVSNASHMPYVGSFGLLAYHPMH